MRPDWFAVLGLPRHLNLRAHLPYQVRPRPLFAHSSTEPILELRSKLINVALSNTDFQDGDLDHLEHCDQLRGALHFRVDLEAEDAGLRPRLRGQGQGHLRLTLHEHEVKR